MSGLRKALALAGTAAAAASLIALPVGSASAASMVNKVTVTVNWHAVDDDSTIFGSSFDHAYGTSTKTFLVGKDTPALADVNSMSAACAGNEVHGDVYGCISQYDNGGTILFSPYLDLYKGGSCYSSDVDGWSSAPNLVLTLKTGTYSFR
ncbi:hypothetical protein OG985_45290 [Streptomyces sp. NBC_00289]|uniref:hypothetical protein n=1 Tax=Streptomyces sp. NBC_00289 TaxID=2975703 RepID=UPI0032434731